MVGDDVPPGKVTGEPVAEFKGLNRRLECRHDFCMKTSALFLSGLLAVFLAPVLHADLTLNTETVTDGEKHSSVIKVSDKGMRIEHPMGAVLIPAAGHKILMINKEMKSVMEMPVTKNAETDGTKAGAPPKFTKTGNKETISGLGCEEYVMTDGSGETMHLWISPQGPDPVALAAFSSSLRSLAKGVPAASSYSMKGFSPIPGQPGGFPIRTVVGNVTNTVLSFSTAVIPAAEFEAPSGYSTMAMPVISSMPSIPQGGGIPKDVQKALQQMQKNGMPGGLTPEQMKAMREAAQGMIPQSQN